MRLSSFFHIWNVESNSFLLPIGPMFVTVLDISLLLGLFLSGVEVLAVMKRPKLAD